MRITIAIALLSASCAFDFSRSDELRPGEVHGTAVGVDGAAIGHVRATVEGLLTPARADAAGGFRVGLGAGVFVVRIVEDKDGDGRAERGALRGVRIKQADIAGERRLTGVELGKVTLLGTGSVRGAIEDETGAPVDADVLVIRTTEGLGDGGDFLISPDDARTLPAEARVRARADAPGFAADGLVPGSVFVVALATDAQGAVLVSAPRVVDVPSEGEADVGVVVVAPPIAPTVDVTLEVVSATAAEEDEVVDVVLASGGTEQPAGTAPVNGAQLLSAVAVGRYDVLATSTLRPDELGGALDGQLALSLEDPANASAPVLWGPLVLVEGALCGALTDRDGDGLPALSSPSADVAAWIACAPACAAAYGTEGAAATCAVGDTAFDCDDDGDLQPDVTEPFACVSLCAATDLDGDGACDDVDDDPRCAIVDDAPVCIGDAAYARPGVRPEYLPAEGEGEGEGEGEQPCTIDADCAPVVDVIALCDRAAGTCASTGVPVPSAPATTFFHGSGGWGVVGSPPSRRDHAMASVVSEATTFDIVMFGGLTASGHTNELFGWTAVDAVWTAIDAGVGPAPRGRAAFAYDSGTDSVLLVGGESLSVENGASVVTTFDDVWELDLVTLTWIDRGPLAGAEAGAALIADRDSKSFPSLVYVRPSGAEVLRTDGLGGFIPVTLIGTPPTFDGDVVGALRLAINPILFGGAQASALGASIITHHELDSLTDVDGSWLEGLSPGSVFPSARSGAAITASSAGIHVFGGDLLDDDAPLDGVSARSNELWLWDGELWSLDIAAGDVPGTLPPPRSGAKMAFDGTHVVIVGGDESVDDDSAAALRLIETAAVPTWTRVPALPVEPRRREAAFAFATDGNTRDDVVVIGGRTADDGFLADTWIFSRATFTWRAVEPLPIARAASAAAHDPVRDVVVLFGGEAAGDQILGDLLELDMTTGAWTTRVDVVGLPSPRKNHGMAYDPTELDVVIAGGSDGVAVLADTFRYDGTTSAARGTLPIAREAPAMTTNRGAGGGGIGLYGGRDDGGGVLGDACELDPTTDSWNCVAINGIAEGPRDEPGYLFDETTGRLVLFGGRDSNGDDRNDLWEILDIADGLATPLAATFVLPVPRKRPVFVWDEQGLFLFGGAP